eukprot:6488060-Amphidinium_carterae.1
MKDSSIAAQAIRDFAQDNVGSVKGRNKRKIAWSEWNTRFGQRLSEDHHDIVKPFEERQWKIRQKNKFGRSDTFIDQRWREHLQSKCKRDYMGEEGCVRLWLPKEEHIDKVRSSYIDGSAIEGSDRLKNPKDEDRGALRKHVHDWGFGMGWGAEHFQGVTTSFFAKKPKTQQDDGKNDGADAAALDEEGLGLGAEAGDTETADASGTMSGSQR